MSNPIKEVIRNKKKQVEAIVFNDGKDDYTFVLKGNKVVCVSTRKLDATTFKKYQNQLWAIFMENRENLKKIHGKSQEEKERLSLLAQFRVYILPDGKVKVIYKRNGKYQEYIYDNIDLAIQAQIHIIEKHSGQDIKSNGEKPSEVIRLFSNIEELEKIRQVLFDWRAKTSEEVKKANDILIRLANNLKRCRDTLKKEAHEQLDKSAEFTDSLDRKNPGACLARTHKASEKLAERIKDIPGIDQFVAKRKTALEIEKKQIQLNIIETIFKLKIILNSNDRFFENRKVIDQKLGQVLYLLQSIWANPYFEAIKEAKKDVLEAKMKISKKEIGLAKKFIAGAISTLQSIQ